MNTQEDSPVLSHRENGVVTLTLNRPRRFNVLSEEMLEALERALEHLSQDKTLRCLVVAAEGRAFCAGHDLKQMRETPEKSYYQALFSRCSALMQTIVAFPVPVIARVQGIATAAGCQLVASCDLAVAARSARFAVSGINAGLFCATPGVALSRNIGRKAAAEMLFTGEFIDAEQARDWGLINRIAEDEALDAAVDELTTSICAKSNVAVRAGKAVLHRQLAMPLPEAYDYACDIMADNMMAEDAFEGIDAFIEKRSPRWRHR